MPCPPDVAKILAELLTIGLLRIRNLGLSQNSERCAVEADHLHNLPELLVDYQPELLDYYWRVERVGFIQHSSREEISGFEPLWDALAEYGGLAKESALLTRG